MPDFEATYFINSDGKFTVNHNILSATDMPISKWYFTNSKGGETWLSFVSVGQTFDIVEEEQVKIAKPFFERNLKNLYSESF